MRSKSKQRVLRGRRSRDGRELAAAALALFEGPLVHLKERPAIGRLLDFLESDRRKLAASGPLLIKAAARARGVSKRRRSVTLELFKRSCDVRRRVASRFRGAPHAELRRAFGVGLDISAAKPNTVLLLADAVLQGVVLYPDALREARAPAAATRLVSQLATQLRGDWGEVALRAEQTQTRDALKEAADRVQVTATALLERAESELAKDEPTAGLQALRALVSGRRR